MLCRGSLDNTYSYGTNNLIKNGAHLVMEAEDIFKYFDIFLSRSKKKLLKNQSYGNSEFQNIYNILLNGEKTADKIALMTNTHIKDVMQKLTLMELEGIIVHEIGKGFKLKEE